MERKDKTVYVNGRVVYIENSKQATGIKTSDFHKVAEYKINISKINSISNSKKQKIGK